MSILNTVESMLNSINSLYNNMENDLEYMCQTLEDLIKENKLYGYEFTRLGGEKNISLFLYPKSKFKHVDLGKNLQINGDILYSKNLDNFKELTEDSKLVANEFNQYMKVILDSTLLKEKFIKVAPDLDIVTKVSLNKSNKKITKIK